MLSLRSIASLALLAFSSTPQPAFASSDSAARYTVHHRFLPHPSSSTPPFIPLGQVSIKQDGSFDPLPIGAGSGSTSGGDDDTVADDDGKGWYQVALEPEGLDTLVGIEQDRWMIASTRSCYLATSRPKLTISTDSSVSTPSSKLKLSYISVTPFTSGSQGRGCPTGSNETSVSLPKTLEEVVLEIKTEVNVARSPSLSAAPVVDPSTGTVVPPEPEKSFFQKYWMYVIGVSLFLITQLGPDEPKSGGGGGAKK
ncbi:hypothetical protein I317_05744 [Kwoniella heveanensis CBS 569]|nr:hypothetical protein I317_05744 [Kwoniella heveanensis CBS 569]